MAAIDPQILLEEAKCYACFAQASLPELLKLALLARISEGGGGGSGTPGGADTQVQYNDGGVFGGDAGFTYDGAGAATLSASVTVPLVTSAGALSFASNGVTRANFDTNGHLLFNANNTYDIGASFANSPRIINVGTGITIGTFGTNTTIQNNSILAPNFSLINGVLLASTLSAATVRTSTAYTVGTLPAAGTAGRRAYVTDATAPTFLGALVGGGAVVTPVFDNGTAWVAG